MTDFEELDKLSTSELHHRAVRTARRHLDIAFFWKLAEYIPTAEVVAAAKPRRTRTWSTSPSGCTTCESQRQAR